MQDLALNSNFSVHLDDKNDLATVDGRDAFEQAVLIRLVELEQDVIAGGDTDENTRQRIELAVNRVADDHEMLDAVAEINVFESTDRADAYTVEVVYESGAVFDDEVSLE